MDGRRRALDNQSIERFFRSFKWEKLYLEEYENSHQLKKIIQEYIEYYNNERPHQSLNDQTPADVDIQKNPIINNHSPLRHPLKNLTLPYIN